jgi:hypothetical protein
MICLSTVDWLERIRSSALDEEAEAHLAICPRCRSIVQELQSQADLGGSPSDLPLDEAVFFPIAELYGDPKPGEIWWSASSYDGPAGYINLDRLLFVVLDEAFSEADRDWVGVAPLWPDVEMASDNDLVLEPHHSDLGMPLRVQVTRQIVVEFEQLDRRLSHLVDEGWQLIEQTLAGEVDAIHTGVPFEGAHDWRLEFDRHIGELIETLQQPYYAAIARAEKAIQEAIECGNEGELISLEWTLEALQRETQSQLALAAKETQPTLEGLRVWAHDPELFDAHLFVEVARDALLVLVHKVRHDWLREVELLIRFNDGWEFSDFFTPRPGEEVELGEVHGHDEHQIDEVVLRVCPPTNA